MNTISAAHAINALLTDAGLPINAAKLAEAGDEGEKMKITKITIEDIAGTSCQFGGGAVPTVYKDRVVLHLEDGSKRLLSDGGDAYQGWAEALPYPENAPAVQSPVALLNFSAFTPLEGTIRQRRATLDECRTLIAERGFESAIGHAATAEAASELFRIDCPVNRVDFIQGVGQVAVVLRLRQRQPEGAILDRARLEQIGYDLLIMERLA